MTSSERHLL